jgi:hypothetical protein
MSADPNEDTAVDEVWTRRGRERRHVQDLDWLPVDGDLLGPSRGPVVSVLDLLLHNQHPYLVIAESVGVSTPQPSAITGEAAAGAAAVLEQRALGVVPEALTARPLPGPDPAGGA